MRHLPALHWPVPDWASTLHQTPLYCLLLLEDLRLHLAAQRHGPLHQLLLLSALPNRSRMLHLQQQPPRMLQLRSATLHLNVHDARLNRAGFLTQHLHPCHAVLNLAGCLLQHLHPCRAGLHLAGCLPQPLHPSHALLWPGARACRVAVWVQEPEPWSLAPLPLGCARRWLQGSLRREAVRLLVRQEGRREGEGGRQAWG